MATKIENLLVGTRGWLHQSWNKNFYPDDMPEDWRLDYYNQYFKALLIPQDVWKQWDAAYIAEIEVLHEPEPFFIFFEVSDFSEVVLDQIKELKDLLKDKAYGVLGMNLSQAEINYLEDELADTDYKLTSCAPRPQIMGWSCDSGLGVLSGEPMFLIRMNDHPMSQLKDAVSPFLDSLPQDFPGGCVFAVDEDVSTKHVTDMKLLFELLGH
ncbi:hypothetical protein [Hydrogenovibrio kuenenii]|uniref:hypothetical protein n=1 Tax=Hydrogenovibrio kuenenii TaxID=63658 RepID=UPI0004669581|nr:hypothetical protein [Hydrogenovibrio kuenenii]